MRFFIYLFALTTSSETLGAFANKIQPETFLACESKEIQSQKQYAVDVFIGTNTNNYLKTKLQIDLESRKTIIGDVSKVGWGIHCEEPECTKGLDSLSDNYAGVTYDYFPSAAFFSFVNSASLNSTKDISKMNFDYVQNDSKAWASTDWGVLGLAPDGDFLKYIFSTFGDFSFTFKVGWNLEKPNDKVLTLDLYLNHEQSQIINQHPISLPNSWNLLGSIQEDSQAGQICLKYTEDQIASFTGAEAFCQKQFDSVCPPNKECSPDTANYNFANSFKVSLRNYVYTIYPKDYLYFNDAGKLSCKFKELSKENSDNCYARLGLGFFLVYPPMFLMKNGAAYVAFLRFFDIMENYEYLPWLLCAFGILFLAMICAICWVNKKRGLIDEGRIYFEVN